MRYYFLFISILLSTISFAQNFSGRVVDKATNEALEFVSIGIIGKDVGTVSGADGTYSLAIDPMFDNDTIRFSSIGYQSLAMRVSEYKLKASTDLRLVRQEIALNEIIVKPAIFEEKIIGNGFKRKKLQGGFRENKKGFELGVLLTIKKRAFLKELICNITFCSYESIFYRVNVYKQTGKNDFENILDKPIYIKQKMDNRKTTLNVDLSVHNIVVEGNTLVTIEHVGDMGDGSLLFGGGVLFGSTCYYRKTSQGNWTNTPIKLGIGVRAEVEK